MNKLQLQPKHVYRYMGNHYSPSKNDNLEIYKSDPRNYQMLLEEDVAGRLKVNDEFMLVDKDRMKILGCNREFIGYIICAMNDEFGEVLP